MRPLPSSSSRHAAGLAAGWLRALAVVAGAATLAACTIPPTAGLGGGPNTAIGDPPLTNATLAQRLDNETLAKLGGTAMLGKGVAVPPGAEFKAELIDPSRPELFSRMLWGKHQRVLGRDIVDSPDDRIVAFMIPYDTSTIDPNQVYVVRATISAGGRTLYTAERSTRVLPRASGTTLDNALVMIKAEDPR